MKANLSIEPEQIAAIRIGTEWIAVRSLAVVDVKALGGLLKWSPGIRLESADRDGSFLVSVNEVTGIRTRRRIATAEEEAEQAAAAARRESEKFSFVHYGSLEAWSAAYAEQPTCAAGAAGHCGGLDLRDASISHLVDGRLYCGADSPLKIRYGVEFDANYVD